MEFLEKNKNKIFGKKMEFLEGKKIFGEKIK